MTILARYSFTRAEDRKVISLSKKSVISLLTENNAREALPLNARAIIFA